MPQLDALPGAQVIDPAVPDADRVLTTEAVALLQEVHTRFEARRQELLAMRPARRRRVAKAPAWPAETKAIRDGGWKVAPIPPPLLDRRVEITGPVDRKMMINALNSGAKVFMADFEDSHSPAWSKTIAGQGNIMDAVRGRLRFATADKAYEVGPDPALLLVRVRGWHLPESGLRIDGEPMSAALFDATLTLLHNAKEQLARGAGPYLYLPKLEGHEEARLWADVFAFLERRVGIPAGSVKVTVLIETLPAAFEMEEILHALRDHIVALNAGRWDYIFSTIKVFADDPTRVLPDRAQITMQAPFMRAYAKHLVDVCHRRGALAMGGMSAFIPNRRRADVTAAALAAVRADKEREVADGCDGTWVAHPDLVPVAMEIFEAGLAGRPNQRDRQVPAGIHPADLVDTAITDAAITDAGIDTNIEVTLRYLAGWLSGIGAVAIHDLMEDAATAEISRCQLWQWRHHGATTREGHAVDPDTLRAAIGRHAQALAAESPEAPVAAAAALLEDAVLAEAIPDFLTLSAYPILQETTP